MQFLVIGEVLWGWLVPDSKGYARVSSAVRQSHHEFLP